MKKDYCFAGVNLSVQIPDEYIYFKEGLLGEFSALPVPNVHNYVFEMLDTLEAPNGELIAAFPDYRVYQNSCGTVRYIGSVENGWEFAYMRIEHNGKEHKVQLKTKEYKYGFGGKTVLNALGAEHLVVEAGGFIMHSSFIEWEGKAILFTAPSGTGKSTQAELWKNLRGANIINGDRSVIRVLNDGIYAAGLPFSGSSVYCKNYTLPLAAIVYLEQAPMSVIREMHGALAFRHIWEGISVNIWDKDDVDAVMSMVQQAAMRVPVYHLACKPDESAIVVLEQELRKREAHDE